MIVTHQPPYRKDAPRRSEMPANEISTAIEMNPDLSKTLEFAVFLKKYDLLVMVKEDILLQPTIQEIEELEDMLVISAVNHQRIHARYVVCSVEPPHALVPCALAFSLPHVLKSVATFGPVDSHQLFQQAGLLLIRYGANESPHAAYGATLPGPIFVTSGTYKLDLVDSISQRLGKLRLSTLPQPALNKSSLATLSPMSPLGLPNLIGPTRTDDAPRSPVPSMHGLDHDDEGMTGQVKRTRDDSAAGSPTDHDPVQLSPSPSM